MKSQDWKTYRTRFLVKAKQLTSTLSFTDHLGRQHCGRKGDYLVESYEGVLSIAPRHIFEDIYVQMSARNSAAPIPPLSDEVSTLKDGVSQLRAEEIQVERIPNARFRFQPDNVVHKDQPTSSRVRRKAPQPVRDPAPRVSLM